MNQLPPFRRPSSDAPAEFVLRRDNEKEYLLDRKFRYVEPTAPHRSWTVPKALDEFRTDLASVPAVATWLVPKDGRHTPAALLHDALVRTKQRPYVGDPVDRAEADRLFRQAMQHLEVGFLRRWAMWSAVSLATTAGPRPDRTSVLDRLWRIVRVAFVFGMMGAVAIAGLALWVDLTDRSWAVLPWLGGNGPRLPWMGRSGPDLGIIGPNDGGGFWTEARGSLAVVVAVTVAAGLAAVGARAIGELVGRRWARPSRPQVRALAFAIAAFTMMTLWVPLVTAAVGWLVYHVAEFVLAKAVLTPLQKLLTWLAKRSGREPTGIIGSLDLVTGPVVAPDLVRLPPSREGL